MEVIIKGGADSTKGEAGAEEARFEGKGKIKGEKIGLKEGESCWQGQGRQEQVKERKVRKTGRGEKTNERWSEKKGKSILK